LKAQWREKFQPDYVFLDSRTGHTDVGGICTRQLPDAVALMFRLDDQNLEGLTRVVSEIRQEEHGPRQKDVKLHFVPSNVPRTDDENNVLNDQIKLFQKKLDFGSPEVRIQHYDDLEMLKHTIFTLTRANTRIAQEYCELAREIARYNTEDVEGARDYIRNILKSRRGYLADSFQERVAKISSKHRQDAKILELLADLSQRQGKVSDAIAYLSEALDTGASKSGFLVRRAELNHRIGDVDAAARDLRRLVDTPIDNFFEVSRTISIARQIDREIIGLLPSSTALASLDVREKRMIANDLLSEDADVAVALEILNDLLDEPDLGDEERRRTLSSMALPLITARKFDQAIDSLDQPTVIQDYFNLAMARWASAGSAPEDLFADVLRLHEDSTSPLDDSANYNFCIAIAKWALGDQEGARQDISVAKQAAREEIGNIFSPWTYRNGDASHFLVDIGQAEEMMDEGSMIPPFILDQSPEETNNA
jgi:tetratricopeptide (TPR) repeat protein